MAKVNCILLLCSIVCVANIAAAATESTKDSINGEFQVFDVKEHGAKGDGKTDDTTAFLDAWNAACKYEGKANIVISNGTYLVGEMTLSGPCYNMGSPNIVLKGTLTAPSSIQAFKTSAWITFRALHGLEITGGGTVDGKGGDEAWALTTCPEKKNCKLMPSSIKVISCTEVKIHDIKMINAKAFNMRINRCTDVKIGNATISAPEDSPNTDGIHVADSTDVVISNSVIGVGDDCISLGDGNNNVFVSGITCGPGHGISIGSLGKYKNESPVSNIYVKNCTLNGTTNGLRIKTWGASSPLIARNITFEDIAMGYVSFPIIIDQKYCPVHHCSDEPSMVQISDVTYKNIRGTSFTKLAVNLICSSKVPCKNIHLNDINLSFQDTGLPTRSLCLNAETVGSGQMVPPACS